MKSNIIGSQRGMALVNALAVITTVSTLGLIFLSVTMNSARQTEISRDNTASLYRAEAAAQQALLQIHDVFTRLDADPACGWTQFEIYDEVAGVTYLTEYKIEQVGSWQSGTHANGANYTFCYFRVGARSVDGPGSAEIEEVISVELTPLFQYAIFYNDNDIELLPGPSMTLWGRMHSNEDIYLNCGSTLSIDTNSLTSASNIYRRRKLRDEARGTVRITNDQGNYRTMSRSPRFDSTHADWVPGSQTKWGGVVKTWEHGVENIDVPDLNSIEPGGYYDQEAQLRIIDGRAYTNGGVDITDYLPSGTITQSRFWNGREGKRVYVYNLDLAKLGRSAYWPSDGLLYMTRSDASPQTPYGFRLINGSELASGLTVVSNDPVYTLGNYNSRNKKPASIICDAINVLSNSWQDSQNRNRNMRYASNTTVNAAFIAGSYESTASDYCGGVENYTRLLEKWTGRTLTVRGSYVYLWHSQIAQGRWGGTGGYYSPPRRDWGYDTDYDDPNNLPPYTPRTIDVKYVSWKQK